MTGTAGRGLMDIGIGKVSGMQVFLIRVNVAAPDMFQVMVTTFELPPETMVPPPVGFGVIVQE